MNSVKIATLILKSIGLALVFVVAGLWAGAGSDTRPKFRDDQTLISATVWSQVVLPSGLILSMIVDDYLNKFIHGYFLFAGILLLLATALTLVIGEYNVMKVARVQNLGDHDLGTRGQYDKLYFSIGIICFVSAIISFFDFVLIIIFT